MGGGGGGGARSLGNPGGMGEMRNLGHPLECGFFSGITQYYRPNWEKILDVVD